MNKTEELAVWDLIIANIDTEINNLGMARDRAIQAKEMAERLKDHYIKTRLQLVEKENNKTAKN